MGAAQKGLLALVGLLLLLMMAGMLCSPDNDEVASTAGSTVAVGETRRAAEGVGLGPSPNGPREEGPQQGHALNVRVTDGGGGPLVGARAVLLPTSGEDRRAAASASADDVGLAALREVPRGEFQLVVTAAGYMSSEPLTVRLPDEAGREIAVRLQQAARMGGSLFHLDGQPALDGVVRLRETGGSGTEVQLYPDERGSVEASSLRPGVWEIAWLPAKGEPPDSRLVLIRAVSSGEQVRLEFTLPKQVEEPVAGRKVGIVELQQR